jgi:hypothetical protein
MAFPSLLFFLASDFGVVRFQFLIRVTLLPVLMGYAAIQTVVFATASHAAIRLAY